MKLYVCVHAVDDHYQQRSEIAAQPLEILEVFEDHMFHVLAAISIELLTQDSNSNPHWMFNEDEDVEYHVWLHYNNTPTFDFLVKAVTVGIEPLSKRTLN